MIVQTYSDSADADDYCDDKWPLKCFAELYIQCEWNGVDHLSVPNMSVHLPVFLGVAS